MKIAIGIWLHLVITRRIVVLPRTKKVIVNLIGLLQMKKTNNIDTEFKAAFITQPMQLKNCTVTVDPKDGTMVVLFDDGTTTFIISGVMAQTFIKTI